MNLSIDTSFISQNEPWRFVAFFAVVTAALLIGRIAGIVIRRLSLKTARSGRHVTAVALRSFARAVSFLLFAAAFPAALEFLVLSEGITGFLDTVKSVLITVAVGFAVYQLTDVAGAWLKTVADRTESKMDDMLIPIVHTSLRITVGVLTLLQVAQSLTDKPLTSLIAGLGVTGLAVALAAQDTIKHFFGSIVLFADRPFQVGDRILVDQHDGVIEQVGFRSTRIRTLTGHLVTIPNGDLANKNITNVSARPYIRHNSVFGVTYDTPPEKVDEAVAIIKQLLDGHEGFNPDFPPRVYFDEFGASSLNIFVMYWYHPPDYWAYKAFNERFNFEVLRRFNAAGLDFAFPTQTVYLAGDAARPLNVGVDRGPSAGGSAS